MRFGDAVVIDGAEVGLENRIDGGEIGMRKGIDGGELGAFYNTGGTSDYEMLAHKPKINGETVIGEKISNDYKLQDKMDVATIAEIEAILYLD